MCHMDNDRIVPKSWSLLATEKQMRTVKLQTVNFVRVEKGQNCKKSL